MEKLIERLEKMVSMESGKLYECWYAISPTFKVTPKIEIKYVERWYEKVLTIRVDGTDHHPLEEVFIRMQGENLSPNMEAKFLIRSLGLTHTSMSVGDLIYDIEGDEWFQVAPFGFVTM